MSGVTGTGTGSGSGSTDTGTQFTDGTTADDGTTQNTTTDTGTTGDQPTTTDGDAARNAAADTAEEYSQTGQTQEPSYDVPEDNASETSYDFEDFGPELDDDGLFKQTADKTNPKKLTKEQKSLLEQLTQNIDQAKNPAQLDAAANQVMDVVENTVEDAQETLHDSQEEADVESKEKQQRQLGKKTLPKSFGKKLLSRARAKGQKMSHQTKSAKEKTFLKKFASKTGQRLRQLASKTTKQLQTSNKFVQEGEENTLDKIWKALSAGGKNVKKDASKLNKQVADADVDGEKLTDKEKQALQKKASKSAKEGVGGEKDLSNKEKKLVAKQFSIKDAKLANKKEAFAKTKPSDVDVKKETEQKSKEQTKAKQTAGELEQPSLEHIAKNVVPALIKHSPEVAKKYAEIAKEKGEAVAALIIAGGESILGKGTEDMDEASLFESASETFNDSLGRVREQVKEGKQEAAEWTNWALGNASKFLFDGRAEQGRRLVNQAAQEQDARINGNPANQIQLSPEEALKGLGEMSATSSKEFSADFEPGNVDGKGKGYAQHFDADDFKERASFHQAKEDQKA